MNIKAIKQSFADVQLKLKVWRGRDRIRRRMKKQFKRHSERLNEAFEYFLTTFNENDVQLVHRAKAVYGDYQDYLRKCYKNDKTFVKFLTGLPEAQHYIAPEDLTRLIQKEENAYSEIHQQYVDFVDVVKRECVMNVHYFVFTSLPELIVRKDYTRAQYDVLKKLLVSVKDAYLKQRNQAEAENVDDQKSGTHQPKIDPNVITEEDLVEISLLDDFLAQHEQAFDAKKELWQRFIQKSKEAIRNKLEEMKDQKPGEK